jgi:hypothetical protein
MIMENSVSFTNGHIALAAILYVFSTYFLINEVRQICHNFKDYFSSIWNYTDFLPPLMIYTIVSYHFVMIYDSSFAPTSQFIITIESVCGALMWLKLLYFLRIFKSTGYLVRMVTEVLWGMKTFLLILFIVYFGFSEAFMRVSEASDPDSAFTGDYFYSFLYVFLTSIGATGTSTFNGTV